MKTTVLSGLFSVLLLFSTAHAESLTAQLKPGEFRWHPERAPSGPVLLAVTIPQQKAYVYRNGVLIGYSTVSTGQRGRDGDHERVIDPINPHESRICDHETAGRNCHTLIFQ